MCVCVLCTVLSVTTADPLNSFDTPGSASAPPMCVIRMKTLGFSLSTQRYMNTKNIFKTMTMTLGCISFHEHYKHYDGADVPLSGSGDSERYSTPDEVHRYGLVICMLLCV